MMTGTAKGNEFEAASGKFPIADSPERCLRRARDLNAQGQVEAAVSEIVQLLRANLGNANRASESKLKESAQRILLLLERDHR
jgi:hypothetical protein